MYTLYVLVTQTESSESNESILLNSGLFKVTGENEQDAYDKAAARIEKLNKGYRYNFEVYTVVPEMPDDPDSLALMLIK